MGNLKAFFVGDNSSNINWGGRAASRALLEVLGTEFQISDAIYGSEFSLNSAGFSYVNIPLPKKRAWIYREVVGRRQRYKLCDGVVRLGELCGVKDFVSIDPKETTQNILRSMKREPRLRQIVDGVRKADVVILHGEGDMVFCTPPRREALYLLGIGALGLHLGKKVAFVNAMISDCHSTGRNEGVFSAARDILSRCHAVMVRDWASLEFIRNEMPEVVPNLIPDALFTWFPVINRLRSQVPTNADLIIPFPEEWDNLGRVDLSKPYICIGGCAAAAEDHDRAVEHFARMVNKVKQFGRKVYLTENDGRDAFLRMVAKRTGTAYLPANISVFAGGAILGKASLFISGRYHPTILASLGGTPSVFLETIGHKMHSLQETLDYEHVRQFQTFPSEAECDEMLGLASQYLEEENPYRERIQNVARRRCEEAMTLARLLKQKFMGEITTPEADRGKN